MSLAIIVKNIITHILCNVISPEHCTLYILFFYSVCYQSLFFFLFVSCVLIKMLKKHFKCRGIRSNVVNINKATISGRIKVSACVLQSELKLTVTIT